MNLYLILVLLFVSSLLLALSLAAVLGQDRLIVDRRVRQFLAAEMPENAVQEELNSPLKERVFKPLFSTVSGFFEKAIPVRSRQNLKTKLVLAGNPGNFEPNEFATVRYGITLLFAGCAAASAVFIGSSLFSAGVLAFLAAFVGYSIPGWFLKIKRNKRADEIQKGLPEVLDLLTVSVEAGLGFDAAVAKVVEKTKGVLSVELAKFLQEVKMGKPRREALRDLNRRTKVEDFSSFISSVVQADQLGVSIGGVLRLQAKETRQKRLQKAEEKAMKAPVKMVIPLVVFIFPTIFIVLLSPALLQIYDALFK